MDTDKGPRTNGSANCALSVSIENNRIDEDDTDKGPRTNGSANGAVSVSTENNSIHRGDTDKGPRTNGSANGAVSVSIENNSIDEDDTERHPMMKNEVQEQRHDKDDIDDPVAIAESSTDVSSLPIDKGWAWMVLLGATLETTIVIGVMKTSGIFFVNFQQRFNSTSSMTALLSTVLNAVYSVTALLIMTVGTKLVSGRTLNMFGGTLVCIGYIISSRAEDIRLLLLSYGVIQALGIACMTPVSLSMVGTYFDKRRGLANSIAVSGGSLGSLIFAPLLTSLFEHYGYSGAMLIVASWFLHGWVTGALFRPPTFYTKKRNIPVSSANGTDMHAVSDGIACEENSKSNISRKAERKLVLKRQDSIDMTESALSLLTVKENSTDSGRRRASTFSEGDTRNRISAHFYKPNKIHARSHISLILNKIVDTKVGKYASSEYFAGSLVDIPVAFKDKSYSSSVIGNTSTKPKSIFKTLYKLFDFSLFKNPVFVILIIAEGLLCAISALGPVFLAPHAKDLGISPAGIATFLTVFSALDLCSRITIGIIADKGWLRRSTIIGISGCVLGISAQFLRFYSNYKWIMVFAVVLGLFSGVYFSLFAVVIVDYLTLAKLKSGLGFADLCHGAVGSLTYAVIGLLRDNTGSYLVPFHLLGIMGMTGALLMVLLPLVDRAYKR